MQITVACHSCHLPKRPLSPCPSCQAPALAEPELQAWRVSLHARHLARIKQTPESAVEYPTRTLDASPLTAVVVLDFEPTVQAVADQPHAAPIIPLEPSLPADEALSFDWEDEPRRVRRTA
jgi:hypothetical protein